jgi:glycosyltransferase involved in cell wall biosynthesis
MYKDVVSILIPTYNREKIILETLNCAVNQTYKNTEIIVVDNKSTDNSFEIIKEFAKSHPNVREYQNEENIGPVRNWRKCLNYATGEYAKILWSDDLIASDFIEKTLPYLIDQKDVGFVFTGTEIFNDNTGQRNKAYFIGETGLYDTGKYIESSLLGKPLPVPVSPGNALFRKKDLEKNLMLDVPNKIGSDFAMHAIGSDVLIYLLTAKDYPRFAFVSENLASFRAHNDSITISSNSMKLIVLYHFAKAYFVENYIDDLKLRRKFNARLFGICLKNLFSGKYGRVTSVKDFYIKGNNTSINGKYLLALLIRRIAGKLFFNNKKL